MALTAEDRAEIAAMLPKPPATTTKDEPVYTAANVAELIAKHGSPERAIDVLWRDAKRARVGKQRLSAELDELKKTTALPDGGVVLKGEDAKKWAAFVKLGKTPEELATTLTTHAELSAKVETQDRNVVVGKAAKAAKFNDAALIQLVTDKKLNVVLKTEKVDGKDVEVAYVQPPEANAAPVKLTDYVDTHLSVYKPSLLAAVPGTSLTGDSRRTPMFDQSSSQSKETPGAAKLPRIGQPKLTPSERAKPAS